eukprot:gene9355-6702_t
MQSTLDAWDKEVRLHAQVAIAERQRGCLPRDDVLRDLLAACSDSTVVYLDAPSGHGKTVVMAKLALRLTDASPPPPPPVPRPSAAAASATGAASESPAASLRSLFGAASPPPATVVVVVRFCGATRRSATLLGLLRSVAHQLERHAAPPSSQEAAAAADDDAALCDACDVAEAPPSLAAALATRVARLLRRRPTLLLLDGVDRLRREAAWHSGADALATLLLRRRGEWHPRRGAAAADAARDERSALLRHALALPATDGARDTAARRLRRLFDGDASDGDARRLWRFLRRRVRRNGQPLYAALVAQLMAQRLCAQTTASLLRLLTRGGGRDALLVARDVAGVAAQTLAALEAAAGDAAAAAALQLGAAHAAQAPRLAAGDVASLLALHFDVRCAFGDGAEGRAALAAAWAAAEAALTGDVAWLRRCRDAAGDGDALVAGHAPLRRALRRRYLRDAAEASDSDSDSDAASDSDGNGDSDSDSHGDGDAASEAAARRAALRRAAARHLSGAGPTDAAADGAGDEAQQRRQRDAERRRFVAPLLCPATRGAEPRHAPLDVWRLCDAPRVAAAAAATLGADDVAACVAAACHVATLYAHWACRALPALARHLATLQRALRRRGLCRGLEATLLRQCRDWLRRQLPALQRDTPRDAVDTRHFVWRLTRHAGDAELLVAQWLALCRDLCRARPPGAALWRSADVLAAPRVTALLLVGAVCFDGDGRRVFVVATHEARDTGVTQGLLLALALPPPRDTDGDLDAAPPTLAATRCTFGRGAGDASCARTAPTDASSSSTRATGRLLLRGPRHAAVVAAVAFAPRGDVGASADHAATVKVWGTVTGEALHSLPLALRSFLFLLFWVALHGATLLYTAWRDAAALHLFDLRAEAPLRVLALPGAVAAFCVARGGRLGTFGRAAPCK